MHDTLKFVLCPSYHGATALAFLLNSHRELSCLGDTLPWQHRDQSCSCGSTVDRCPFWGQVRRGVGINPRPDQLQMLPLIPQLSPIPFANRSLVRAMLMAAWLVGPSVRHVAPRANAELARLYRRFYRSIRDLQGTQHVVDGSKSISKVLALTLLTDPPQRAQVVHLIRDPRGYAASLQRRGVASARPSQTGSQWRRAHSAIRLLFKGHERFDYLAIRYEDLCRNTDATMTQVFDFLRVSPTDVHRGEPIPCKNHLIGNKMLKHFDGALKLDVRWQSELSAGQKSAILRRARGEAQRYGYT